MFGWIELELESAHVQVGKLYLGTLFELFPYYIITAPG